MLEHLKPYVRGLLTYTPLAGRYTTPETGGTDDARYCYGVFLRHLIQAGRVGERRFPGVVAELGPGDSIGAGLSWLIAGAERYLAFDVHRYANVERNLRIFDELVGLLQSRADVPGDEEFPEMKPRLERYGFPHDLLAQDQLDSALATERIATLRNALAAPDDTDGPIAYVVPWNDTALVRPASVDMIFSQAVMEHVEDVDGVYACCKHWLRSGGLVSHQIDFRSHGTAPTWDGYRAYSELEWRIVRGRRAYLINRVPDSGHVEALERHGFRIVNRIPVHQDPTLDPRKYAERFRGLDDESRRTSGLFVQAVANVGG